MNKLIKQNGIVNQAFNKNKAFKSNILKSSVGKYVFQSHIVKDNFDYSFLAYSKLTLSSLSCEHIFPNKTILILGSSGFIGKRVIEILLNKDYKLRTPSNKDINFLNPDWENIEQYLYDVDVVINLVGVMSENDQMLEQIHHLVPLKIAILAKKFHVKHWINLSALGACSTHLIGFVASKGRGDNALMALADNNFQVTVVRPSLVFGRGGTSSEMFLRLASLPVIILPNAGKQPIQPVHINDVAQGIAKLVSITPSTELSTKYKLLEIIKNQSGCVINMTGATRCTVAEYLIMMRRNIHHKTAPVILTVPISVATVLSTIIRPLLPNKFKPVISKDALKLLQQGSIADNTRFNKLLGRCPAGYEEFV